MAILRFRYFRRVKARNKIADNVTLFDNYDVAEGEKPSVATKYMVSLIIFGL